MANDCVKEAGVEAVPLTSVHKVVLRTERVSLAKTGEQNSHHVHTLALTTHPKFVTAHIGLLVLRNGIIQMSYCCGKSTHIQKEISTSRTYRRGTHIYRPSPARPPPARLAARAMGRGQLIREFMHDLICELIKGMIMA